MINIIPAQVADLPEIDTLLDAGFGPARHNRTAYRLRDGLVPDPALSFVARLNMQPSAPLIGSLQCWPLQLRSADGNLAPLTLLGPVVTAATHRGHGVATALMGAALAAIDTTGRGPVLLIGDVPFYDRFGFSTAATANWMLPGPVDRTRLLLRGVADALPAVGWIEPSVAVRKVA